MKVLIPDTIALDLTVNTTDEFVQYGVDAPIPVEHADAEVLVVWANPAANLQSAVRTLPNLKFIQTLAAGPDAVVQAGFAQHVQICSGRSLHDGPVAEHTLAMMLYVARDMHRIVAAQSEHVWRGQMVADQAHPTTRQLYTLAGARVVIVGFGSIAARLAPMLTALGAEVTGVANSAGDRHGYPVVAMNEVASVLPTADWVVSILPHTPATEKIVDAAFLAQMQSSAVFVNVGRGKTVDEAALVTALQSGIIRAAAIDVTYVEPNPADSPLWDCPNLLITPHVAGGRPIGGDALLLRQLAAWHAGLPLANRVV